MLPDTNPRFAFFEFPDGKKCQYVRVSGLEFDDDGNLKVIFSGTIDVESKFGDNSNVSTKALTDESSIIRAASADNKEVFIANTTNETIWIFYGDTAVFGKGIPLSKGDILIEDRYRGKITAIMDTGKTGNIEVTSVTK